MAEPTSSNRSRMVGGFELIEKIGVGGMGAVFKARQQSLDRLVALKILPPKLAQDKEFVARFIREARASAALNHPNIVQGIDVGEDHNIYYFAMELIDGETVGQWYKREKPLPESDVLEIARQTCLALEHAHSKSLLHRDIKPDNLMVTMVGSRNNSFTLKLMDLGLARGVDASEVAASEEGQAVGTPYYIAPEQARGEKILTPACDLYALGATMFHILTGRPPFEGPNGKVIMTKHLTDPAPDAHAINPKVSRETAKLVMRLMSKNPADRPASARELATEIERIQKGETRAAQGNTKSYTNTGKQKPVTNKGLAPIPESQETQRKGGIPILPVAIAAVVVVGLTAFLLLGKNGNKPAELPPVAVKETKPTPPDPKKEDSEKPSETAHNKPPVAPVSDKPEDDPAFAVDAKTSEAEKTKRQERLKHLLELRTAAEEVATQKPADLEAQKEAWTELRDAGKSTRFMVVALDKLKAIEDKRLAEADGVAQKECTAAEEELKDGKYDAALERLEKIRLYGVTTATKQTLSTLQKKIAETGQAEGDKALASVEELQAHSTAAAALEALKKATEFPYKPVAAEAQKRLDEINKAQETAKLAQAKATQERVRTAVRKLQEKVAARQIDAALTDLAAMRKDQELASAVEQLKFVEDSLKMMPTLSTLVTKKLEGGGKAGITCPPLKGLYFKLENERLYYKPDPVFPQLTNKAVNSITWEEWLALASLTGPNAGDGLAQIPTDKAVDYAGLFVLAQQAEAARNLLKWARTDPTPATETRATFWDDQLKALADGPAVATSSPASTTTAATTDTPDTATDTSGMEAKATARLTDLKKQITAKNWKEAVDTLRELRTEKYSSTAYLKQHAKELTLFEEVLKLSAPTLMAQVPPPAVAPPTPPVVAETKPVTPPAVAPEKPAKPLTLATLFKGKVTDLGNGAVKIDYDFKDPTQLEDFEHVGGGPVLKNGEVTFAAPGVAYHKAHWISPYKLTVMGKGKSEFRLLVGCTGEAKTTTVASSDGWRARVVPPARMVLYRDGSEYADRRTEPQDITKPTIVDAVLDDRKFSFFVSGVKVIDINDSNMKDPFNHARWAIQRYDEDLPVYVGITIIGRLNPDWLKLALSGALPAKKEPKAP